MQKHTTTETNTTEAAALDGRPFLARQIDALAGAGIAGSDLLVMLALLSHANIKTGRCFPSHATISASVGRCVRTVQSALDRLEHAGHIKRDGRSPAGRAIAWIVPKRFLTPMISPKTAAKRAERAERKASNATTAAATQKQRDYFCDLMTRARLALPADDAIRAMSRAEISAAIRALENGERPTIPAEAEAEAEAEREAEAAVERIVERRIARMHETGSAGSVLSVVGPATERLRQTALDADLAARGVEQWILDLRAEYWRAAGVDGEHRDHRIEFMRFFLNDFAPAVLAAASEAERETERTEAERRAAEAAAEA